MGAKCCGSGIEDIDTSELGSGNAKLNLKSMYMNEFEQLVKKYAHPGNKGMVKPEQLMEAFKDTKIFSQLDNPNSVVNRIVMSPFFTEFTMSHYASVKEDPKSRSVTPERKLGQSPSTKKIAPTFNEDMAIGTESRDQSIKGDSFQLQEAQP